MRTVKEPKSPLDFLSTPLLPLSPLTPPAPATPPLRLGIGPVGGKVGGNAVDLGLDPRQALIQLGAEERS